MKEEFTITCVYYNCKFLNSTTCIKKQIKLNELLKKEKKKRKVNKKNLDVMYIRNSIKDSEYYSLLGCVNCKIGKKLYNEWRKKNKNTKTPIRSNYGTLVKKEEPIELYTRQAIITRGGL